MEKLQKLRSRLAKQRGKIAEMEAQALELEQAIRLAEDEQLGYLARSIANTLSGGMEELLDMLRGLRGNQTKGAAAGKTKTANNANKEVEAIAETE